MKILIAGATGAIGTPLISLLSKTSHKVYGITQSPARAKILSDLRIQPLILNVLDHQAVTESMTKVKPDIVIDMLTHLPREYTSKAMAKAAEMDRKIRVEGGGNLQTAAEQNNVSRYIVQSSGFWYEPGEGLADETCSFAFQASPGIAAGTRIYESLENRVLNSNKLDGIALRFGFFYGPGTWFYPNANMHDQLKKQEFPLIGKGQGCWQFVHIEDAAKGIIAALECPSGIYNIVNDQPSKMSDWLPAFARYLNAPPPLTLSEQEATQKLGLDAVYYATQLRGASNAKAKKYLHFQPRAFEWLNS